MQMKQDVKQNMYKLNAHIKYFNVLMQLALLRFLSLYLHII